MKGIAHFISGVAAASCFPWTVEAAMRGDPTYFILGGFFGILPDTLDFKFYRFFYRHDFYVDPDPFNPDPQAVADVLARAMRQALDTGKTVRIKLNTVRMGADMWQQYQVEFDTKAMEIRAKFGPVVTTGQVPVPGARKASSAVGLTRMPCPFIQTYDAVTKVDIFDGPTFSLVPDGQGNVAMEFLPWHRTWSHSLVTTLGWALIGLAIWDWRAALVIYCGSAIHIMEDQLGLMGSALFFPFHKKRFKGLHLMRSGDSLPNFAAVWTSCLLIFWNLHRHLLNPRFDFSLLQLFVYGALVPGVAVYLLHKFFQRIGQADDRIGAELENEEDPLLS